MTFLDEFRTREIEESASWWHLEQIARTATRPEGIISTRSRKGCPNPNHHAQRLNSKTLSPQELEIYS